jgi:protoporphyrinogen oxidase
MRFIVIGAGLSGLTCAAILKKHGHDVCLVEKESVVGGLARSYRAEGHTFDYGPHFLFGQKVVDLIQEQFPRVSLNRVHNTKEKMYFRQKYFKFPFDPKNILFHMEKGRIPRVLLELILKRSANHTDNLQSQNVEDWVIGAVGRSIYDYISLGGYIQKLYGLPPTLISHEWGLQKLKFLAKWRDANLFTLIAKSILEGNNLRKRVIHYPAGGGIDQLALGIRDEFRCFGGELSVNSEVLSIQHTENGVSMNIRQNKQQLELSADFLISTIPITRLVEMLSPHLSFQIKEKTKSLRYRNLLLLYIYINRERALRDQCIYFTKDPFFFRRITEFKNLVRNMAPKDTTSLCVEITCFENDTIFHRTKEDIFDEVIDVLEGEGFLSRQEVADYHLVRVPFAYPVYELGYGRILEEILNSLKSYGNLISIGRQGLYYYNAMNRSIISSTELGNKLSSSDKSGLQKVIEECYRLRMEKYNADNV